MWRGLLSLMKFIQSCMKNYTRQFPPQGVYTLEEMSIPHAQVIIKQCAKGNDVICVTCSRDIEEVGEH